MFVFFYVCFYKCLFYVFLVLDWFYFWNIFFEINMCNDLLIKDEMFFENL